MRCIACLLGVAALVMCGCGDKPEIVRPDSPVWCRAFQAPPWDARKVLGLSEEKAQAEAESAGCDLRIVRRDGVEVTPQTADASCWRIPAVVENDTVTAVGASPQGCGE